MSKKLFLSQSLFWGILGWNLCNDCWWCSCIRQTECYNAASVICWVGFRRESRNEAWRTYHWCAPISIWGDIAPKREKIAEKWQSSFEYPVFCYRYLANCVISRPKRSWNRDERDGRRLSRVRVARVFQQRCCFFAVTSVTLEVKKERRKESISHKRRRKKGVFLRFIVENLIVK